MLIERDQRDDQPCLLDLHAVSLAAVDTTTRGDQKQLTRQNKLPLTAAENVCGEGGGGRGEEGGPIKGCRRVGGQEVPQRAANDDEPSRRREGCHFADTPVPSMLKHLLEGEGGAAEWQSRRRLSGADEPISAFHRLLNLHADPVEPAGGLTAAIPMENPYCSCELTSATRIGTRGGEPWLTAAIPVDDPH